MTGEDDLGQALNYVRKAYRLIWLYQTRIKDIIRIISDNFDHVFYAWDTDFGRPGTLGTDPINRPMWSMLPFYRIHLLHLPPGADTNHPKSGEWMFAISVEADDGFVQNNQSDPVPTEFNAPEESKSWLSMCAFLCTTDTHLNWYYDIWKKTDWLDEEDLVVDHKTAPVKLIAKWFDLSVLRGKTAVENAVGEFKEATKKLGLQL
jgi:hypothetical protein